MALPITDETLTTADLVRRAQAGDREAFGLLYVRFERPVFAVCWRRVRNHAEAQEVCQEVFLQAMRKLPQLREAECFPGWLRSIASRLAINRVLRRSPETSIEPESLDAATRSADTPLDNVLRSERSEQVRAGLGRLKPLDRETLVAFYVQDRSLLEMSESFDAPLGTIKRRLHTARQRLAAEADALGVA